MNSEKSSNWRPLLEERERRLDFARGMGGEKKLAARREAGLPNARELIDMLCDEGSFDEIGALAGGVGFHGEDPVPADALVGGHATLNGRPIVVSAEDFTVKGGSIGAATVAKKFRLADMAGRERVPFVMFLDGAGERMGGVPQRRSYAPNDMQVLARIAKTVPMVSVVVGSSAGHGAVSGLLADFIIMLEAGTLFSAGPALVEAASGEKISKEELGDARMHTSQSGVAHNLVKDAREACDLTRRYLGFMPDSAWRRPPIEPTDDPRRRSRRVEEILDILPRDLQRPYDVRDLIKVVIDDPEEWLEVQPDFAKSMVVGLARLGGRPIGVVANQPLTLAGVITAEGAQKSARFIDICNAYHLPTLFLADNPGVMTGGKAEREGTLRHAAEMFAAQCRLRAPKLHLTLRKAFGFGSSLMAMNPFDNQTVSFALPGIALGAMPSTGGGRAANLDEDAQRQADQSELDSAWLTGDNLGFDDIIDPADIRDRLLAALLRFPRDTTPPTPLINP